MSFPNKEHRTACYNARDAYWACLDTNEDKVEACVALRKVFVANCASTWVKHFDRKREYEKFKDEVLNQGFQPEKGEAS